MYNFIDVNQTSEGYILPSEALKLNGEYIENQIPGYRTLNVSGREALSPEIETYQTGIRDGSKMKYRRFPARVITVRYQLMAETPEAFRAAYNKLGGILNVTDAQMVFNDEPDKFFTGTPYAIGEVEPGMKSVVGEIEFLCVDPFKYSLTLYETTAQDVIMKDDAGKTYIGKGFVVDYNGTYKSFPTFESKFFSQLEDGVNETTLTDDGDCGFVAFFNEEGKILQFGNPEELDGYSYDKSQTLINQTFASGTAWGTTAKKLWALNNGVATKHEEKQVGGVKMYNFSGTGANDWCLIPSDYGSGATRCGPSITRTLAADASGEVGAKDFILTYKQRMNPSDGKDGFKEVGIFHALVVSGSGSSRKILAGVRIAKHSVGDTAGKINIYVNDKMVHEQAVRMSARNEYFSALGNRVTTIRKEGNTVVFNIAGIRKTFNCYDTGFEELKATQVTFSFSRYSAYPPLSFNGLYYAKFTKNNCTTFKEIPNKFSADDVLTADCSTGEVLLNSLDGTECSALGNDWESFYLKPGLNQIGVGYSDWLVDPYEPTIKMRYREVFL